MSLRRIAWAGPTDRCFEWMQQRLIASGIYEIVELHNCEQVLGDDHFDRIVIACRNRIDYPWCLIQCLEENSLVTPWAMVVDSWWEGARRTGIGTSGHIVLPWYRWLDGWRTWFFPEDLLGCQALARLFSASHVPRDWALCQHGEGASRSHKNLVVVAGCEQTALAWIGQARQVGMDAKFVAPERITEPGVVRETGAVSLDDLILLDDTLLGSIRANNYSRRLAEIVRRCRSVRPGCHVVVAASFPRWEDWLLWQDCGACDIIAKPTFGLPLANIL